ncbi:ASCH domain-containing protein [Spectribacter hydrogenoxidans]|uniref:ASCH domain-containing protein n=1 Tax=Spectribacter hydrogenoxidans TaxID=3075608 RepID=A0ABU3C0J8_9GAMM|nr:ASCH domain-containing protein [Salinisphaera sp. W335]MDT0635063.1 ASCH domain-containing protein [Salinisphaera sp. W335]
MKALTICQPYAHLIAIDEKRVENRSWPTRYRGPLAIHAGKSRKMLAPDIHARYPDMVFGAVVAIAELIDCLPADEIEDRLHDQRYPFLKWQAQHIGGPWCWVLSDTQPLAEPDPCGGSLGLWNWTPRPQS